MGLPDPICLPVVITNNTGLSPDQVYVLIYGQVPECPSTNATSVDEQFVFIQYNPDGSVNQPVPTTGVDTPPSIMYSYPLNYFTSSSGNAYYLYLPPLDGGRIYVSLKTPLSLVVGPNSIGEPTNLFDPSVACYSTIFDKVEFSYFPSADSLPSCSSPPVCPNDNFSFSCCCTLNGLKRNQFSFNTTAVDFFGLPMYLYMHDVTNTSAPDQNAGCYQTRHCMLFDIQATLSQFSGASGTEWNNLILPTSSTPLDEITRVMSAAYAVGHNIGGQQPPFDPNFLNNFAAYGYSWASDVWFGPGAYYRSTSLTLTINENTPTSQTYKGQVTNFISPDSLAYVTNYTDNTVSVINVDNGVSQAVGVGDRPWGIVETSDSQFVYTANFIGNTVSVIDTFSNTVAATVTVGNGPQGIAIAGSSAYVANYNDGTVSVIDTSSNTVSATVTVGINPQGVAIIGTSAYVTNSGSANVSVINTGSNIVSATVAVGTTPQGIAITGTSAYVANAGSSNVSVINTGSNTVSATVAVGTSPQGVAATPDGSSVYVTNYGSTTVSIINTASNTVSAIITVGTSPSAVAIARSSAYVTNYGDNTVSVIDTISQTVTALVTVGTNPQGVVILSTPQPTTPIAYFVFVPSGGDAVNTYNIPWQDYMLSPPQTSTTQGIMAATALLPGMTTGADLPGTPTDTSDMDAQNLCQIFVSAWDLGSIPGSAYDDTFSQTTIQNIVLANQNYIISQDLSPPGKTTGPWFDAYSQSIHRSAYFNNSTNAFYSYPWDDFIYGPPAKILNVTPGFPIYCPGTYIGIDIMPLN